MGTYANTGRSVFLNNSFIMSEHTAPFQSGSGCTLMNRWRTPKASNSGCSAYVSLFSSMIFDTSASAAERSSGLRFHKREPCRDERVTWRSTPRETRSYTSRTISGVQGLPASSSRCQAVRCQFKRRRSSEVSGSRSESSTSRAFS